MFILRTGRWASCVGRGALVCELSLGVRPPRKMDFLCGQASTGHKACDSRMPRLLYFINSPTDVGMGVKQADRSQT